MSSTPISFQGLVTRAQDFVSEWAGESRERAEKDTFWNEFLDIFGVKRRRVATFEQAARRHSSGNTGHIDLFWASRLAVEHKSEGEDLSAAMDQLFDYLTGGSISQAELPGLAVVCDFSRFVVKDLDTGDQHSFDLGDLPLQVGIFGSLAGFTRHRFASHEDEANAQAAELLGLIHDELMASGYDGHHLRVLLVRLLFLLFADDTRVWDDGPGLFAEWLFERTADDGSDLGHHLKDWFDVLNTPFHERSKNLDIDLASLPFVNGGLFEEDIPRPFCNEAIRRRMLEACKFDWSAISPAVFGSMFQSVMDEVERRRLGAHYTTEANIRKVIDPLFMDELREKLETCGNGKSPASRRKLEDLQNHLASLQFFDPACGCGNFLVVAYRDLRKLELEINRRLRPGTQQLTLFDLEIMNKVKVSQFHGIEIEEFPARIAQTAMWLAEHIANLELGQTFNVYYAQFPLQDPAHIMRANAVREDWEQFLPSSKCDFIYGNPPFSGHARAGQIETMREDKEIAFEPVGSKGLRIGRLDYVSCWFAKAIPYLKAGNARAAFVTTNSLTQGEQARSLGPLLDRYEIDIDFAHRTFAWSSEARKAAVVHVCIVGFSPRGRSKRPKMLFDYPKVTGSPLASMVREINAYLVEAPKVYPAKRTSPLAAGLPSCSKGSQPTDGKGGLLVEPEAYLEFASDPVAAKYLRPFRQSKTLLYGLDRWCLWLTEASPSELKASAPIRSRLAIVKQARLASSTPSVRKQADTPWLFTQRRQPSGRYFAMPEVSSSARRYIPGSYLDESVIAGNKLIVFENCPLWMFGFLHSSMFMAWVRTVVGRLKSDFSISPSLAYFTFPFPELTPTQRRRIEAGAQAVLDARQVHSRATLADLYDPLTMPADLQGAHRTLDAAVDATYGRHRHTADASRLRLLFQRFLVLTGGDTSLFEYD